MLTLDSNHLSQISAHALEVYPHECCGVLVGKRDEERRVVLHAIRCRNTHEQPATRYTIDPAELIAVQRKAREDKLEIVGFYHSHPDHPPSVSATDLAEADWPGCSYVIVSVESGRITGIRSFLLSQDESHRTLLEEALVNATRA